MKKLFFGQSTTHYALTVTAFLLLFSTVYLPAASYAAAVSGSPLCASNGSGLCLSDLGRPRPGNPIVMRDRRYGSGQNISLVALNVCNGGKVNRRCPFTNHTFDGQFYGSKIYHLKFNANSKTCISANGSSVETSVCNGFYANGVNWVMPKGTHQLVNVADTNRGAFVEYLNTAPLNHKAAIKTGSATNWAHP